MRSSEVVLDGKNHTWDSRDDSKTKSFVSGHKEIYRKSAF
jgi:hypothetical protein